MSGRCQLQQWQKLTESVAGRWCIRVPQMTNNRLTPYNILYMLNDFVQPCPVCLQWFKHEEQRNRTGMLHSRSTAQKARTAALPKHAAPQVLASA